MLDNHEINEISAFVKIAPLLNQLVQDDITVGIYDTEKLIINIPAKTFSLNVKPGDPLLEGDVITNAIRQNKPLSAIVPKDLFGFPLVARAIPLHDQNGKVIGGVGIGTSLERAHNLFEMAEGFSAIVQQIVSTIENINGTVEELSDRVKNMSVSMQKVSSSAEDIGQISSVVKGISDQSNLLGLNAAIEAARAGENGKGFAVVADEVRKLATNSKQNADRINQITNEIQQLLKALNQSFVEINALTDTQSKSMNEFAATIQEMSIKAQQLAHLAEEMLDAKESP